MGKRSRPLPCLQHKRQNAHTHTHTHTAAQPLPPLARSQATRDGGTVFVYGAMAGFEIKVSIPDLLFRQGWEAAAPPRLALPETRQPMPGSEPWRRGRPQVALCGTGQGEPAVPSASHLDTCMEAAVAAAMRARHASAHCLSPKGQAPSSAGMALFPSLALPGWPVRPPTPPRLRPHAPVLQGRDAQGLLAEQVPPERCACLNAIRPCLSLACRKLHRRGRCKPLPAGGCLLGDTSHTGCRLCWARCEASQATLPVSRLCSSAAR